MALRDTLRNLIGIPENDYDNDYDDEMQSGNIDQQEEEQTSMASPASDRKHNKVVNIHATTQLAVVLSNRSVMRMRLPLRTTSTPKRRLY